MVPSPTELKYFIEISSTLNLSRAAERLGISQPTLTLAVKRLEEGFGLPLLIRSKSGVKLTHAGRRLVSHARSLFDEWDKVRANALKDDAEIRGVYTIGCHPSVALYSLPNVLPRLLAENSGLEIKLVHDLSRRITEEVISFRVDFGIVVNPWEHPDLVIRPLCTDEVTLWTASLPSELQNPTSGEGVLTCDPDLLQTQALLKKLDGAGYRFKRLIPTNNLEVATSLVKARAAVGILPGRVARRISEWGLKPVSKDAPKFPDRICLVYRADAQASKAARTVAKKIQDWFNPTHFN